jgi:hypothetical protein
MVSTISPPSRMRTTRLPPAWASYPPCPGRCHRGRDPPQRRRRAVGQEPSAAMSNAVMPRLTVLTEINPVASVVAGCGKRVASAPVPQPVLLLPGVAERDRKSG